MKYFFLLMLATSTATAQSPQVPHKLQFAGMTLTIREDARKEIQKDVDALTQSPRHFMIKVERARTYFPIIERVFEEERLPDDFKYLVLQESALIPDAVSVSNAVGFWQFKDFTAEEVGLRVDKEVDERMNIVSSSRGAARYLKKNNFYFNNWLFALQAYQMGAGGVMQSVKDYHSGATHMEVTSKTYWYVKKYLAHKIAFEGAVEGPGAVQITAYESNGKSDIRQLAAEYKVNEEELQDYNKWIRKGTIPDDKRYAVIIPRKGEGLDATAGHTPAFVGVTASQTGSSGTEAANAGKETSATLKINGLTATKAKSGESASALARRLGIKTELFLKYNDMSLSQKVVAGEYYFDSKKRSRSEEAFHKVGPGESLWSVSQRYGIKLKKLQRFNRLNENEKVEEGTMLYLASKRPKNDKAQPLPSDVLEVDKNDMFTWSVDPDPVSKPVTTVSPNSQNDSDKEPRDPVVSEQKVSAPPGQYKAVEPVVVQTLEDRSNDTPPASVERHIVEKGETLYSIAKNYGVSVTDLAAWNGVASSAPIHEGQVLTLTASAPSSPEPGPSASARRSAEIVHEVKSSDTLYSVARKYGVTIKEIMDWNGKTDFNIHVGEKLKIIQ